MTKKDTSSKKPSNKDKVSPTEIPTTHTIISSNDTQNKPLNVQNVTTKSNDKEKNKDKSNSSSDKDKDKDKSSSSSDKDKDKSGSSSSSLSRKQKKLITRLNSSYCKTGKMERILPILTGKSKISLRLIDWFVTNYAKVNNTYYSLSVLKAKRESKDKELKKTNEVSVINSPTISNNNVKTTQKKGKDNKLSYFNDLFFVYPSYRQELKTNSKKRFDVFCRNGSINYYYDDKKFIETNDGQLNFFDWADNMYVIDYIEENYDDIEKDMEARNVKKPSGKKESQKGKKKANTIAVSPLTKETESQKVSKRREISESALKTIHHIKHRSVVSFD
uniref:Uncharacterized protein n=1 Tax=viral metagenome TaxID=1070528 RepID=A0A6C0EC79_9ZZZZ